MTDIDADWCEENPVAAAREIDRLQRQIFELEEKLERLRDGEEVVLPQSRDHANYMAAVAKVYLDKDGQASAY